MTKNIIETFDLTKIYKLKGGKMKLKALNNVNIAVKEGEIFGLLGPNGAGKTTMIQILTTLIQPTSGYAIVDGYNILKNTNKVHDRIALMLSSKMIYYRITAYDNLKFFCKIYEVPNYKNEIKIMAEEFGLLNWLNEYVENFSSGMKMKLALCRTLLLNRNILFLDEPTLGLDVKSIAFIVDKIKNLKKTIFLTCHDMNVVEKLCDRIAFIDNGKIVKMGTQQDLKRLIKNKVILEVEIIKGVDILIKELNKHNFIHDVNNTKKGIEFSLENRNYYKEMLSTLANHDVLRIKEQDLSISDLFLKIIE